MRAEKLKELKRIIKELKTISCEEVNLEGKGFLSIKGYNFKLKDGKIITREQIIKGGKDGSAAIILPVTKEGNIVVIIESRAITKEGVGVGFPAGYIENGENPKEAAFREITEETGYQPKRMELLAKYYQDQGCSKAFNHSFIAFDCEKTKEQNLDSDELIRYMEFTFKEVIELDEKGYINDANSLLALERAKKYF